MGVDRCGWVRRGTGHVRGTKTKQAGGIYGLKGQDLGAMAGEIFPSMMFLVGSQKMARMGADGYKLIRMGANGCMSNGENKNKVKRTTNARSGDVF